MAAATKNFLGIDLKMYRHFAGITLAVSVVVGVFADGETQEAMAQTESRTKLKAAETKKFGRAKIGDNRKQQKGSFGSETSRYGEATDGGSGGGGIDPGLTPASASLTAGPMPVWLEIDKAKLARMSPAQRAAYLKKVEEERQKREREGPVMPTQAQISALAAASAARSGSDSID